ncbi:protein TIC 22-like, chloroplastic isoform X1 [Oryza sativa Japonica Group]|uniref:protein TIC 22-like, chloroplastic isoform X1 n=1 Tax=Oryza sativa subsp. japonica TaxID=39947 RepID=UPI0007753D3B|nr:protein TIC 22-like, chloroplastic isoform X1 [Oryza sativa Japonica Group]
MPFHFQFPWLPNNPTSSSSSPTKPPSPAIPNPFLPIQAGLASFLSSLPLPRAAFPPPPWARISSASASAASASALPVAEIEERLAGVPVYALANSSQEFVLVSSARGGGGGGGGARAAVPPPALGLLCFRREDADALLAQMDGDMAAGSTVVPVALNKVIQLKSDGVAFRFVPDSSQVANAMKLYVSLQLMENEGQYVNDGFPGVPVFQSRSLVLMSDNKRYRPVFFRKEDLDNSLHRASRDQQKPNPAVKMGDIQVSSLENIIKSMKDSSSSKWDDAVFIPPGFDLATSSKQSNHDN